MAEKELYADYKVSDPYSKPDGMRWGTSTPTEKEEPKKEVQAKEETPKSTGIDMTRVIQEAMDGDESASDLLQAVASTMGLDDGLEISKSGIFYKDANGQRKSVGDLAQYNDLINNHVATADELYKFKASKSASTKEDKKAAIKDVPPEKTSSKQKVTVSSQGAARSKFDELTPEEQEILHRRFAVDAAYTGKADQLNELLDGPYKRENYKSLAEARHASASGKASGKDPRFEYQYNDEYGTTMVLDKDSGQRLYAMDPEGNPMPTKYFNNVEAWRYQMESLSDSLGLEKDEGISWNPRLGFLVHSSKGVTSPRDYAQMKLEARNNASGNLGTAKTRAIQLDGDSK